jgi:hypothetical protein
VISVRGRWARALGADCRAHARRTEQPRHSVVTSLQQTLLRKQKNCDYMQQIYSSHSNVKSFIYYGGKLCLHTWLVHARVMQIQSKTYIETVTEFTCMPCYCYSSAIGVDRRRSDLRTILLSTLVGCRMRMSGSFGASSRTFPS